MNVHQRDQCAKLKGGKTIRKRPNDAPMNPNLAYLQKVNRTKVPPKKKFIQSPRKGEKGAKSQSKTTPPDSSFEEEDFELAEKWQETRENSEDPDYDPQEDPIVQEIAKNKKQRRSSRNTKKPENTVTAKPSQRTMTLRDLSKFPQENRNRQLPAHIYNAGQFPGTASGRAPR